MFRRRIIRGGTQAGRKSSSKKGDVPLREKGSRKRATREGERGKGEGPKRECEVTGGGEGGTRCPMNKRNHVRQPQGNGEAFYGKGEFFAPNNPGTSSGGGKHLLDPPLRILATVKGKKTIFTEKEKPLWNIYFVLERLVEARGKGVQPWGNLLGAHYYLKLGRDSKKKKRIIINVSPDQMGTVPQRENLTFP